MGILVLLMGIGGIIGVVGLFLGAASIISLTANQMIFLATVTVVNLMGVGIETSKGKG